MNQTGGESQGSPADRVTGRHPNRERRCSMVYLKACPKCLGDLTVAKDGYGTFISCLQCGFMKDLEVKGASRVTAPSAAAWNRVEERLPRAA